MARYLDPKADLTFKKVFGEHPDLVISLLNALLPFKTKEEEITDVTYLPAEMVPDNPLHKDSIVDVRCKDRRGRQFIVEMQMVWSEEFMQRVLFNSAKAYVRQLNKGHRYELLEPVYSLNLVNETFEKDLPDEYYHYYHIVHEQHTDRVIEGLHLVFVELPKFRPHTMTEKKMQVLWLRFLTEIEDETREVSQELLDNRDIRKAVDIVEESAYTPEQLLGYDKFWDIISTERTLISGALRRGKAEGVAQGIEKGIAQGIAQGIVQGIEKGIAQGRAEGETSKALDIARNLKALGLNDADIQKATGLSEEELHRL